MQMLLKTSFALLALFVAAASPGIAQAQEQAAPLTDPCGLTAIVQELAALRADPFVGYLEEFRAEADIRRRLLAAAITCDRQEIALLSRTLEELPQEMKDQPAYGRIAEGLAAASRYYDEHAVDTSGLGLQDMRNTSRSLAEWRRENYAPLVALADNFILWADTQKFLDRTSGRLGQVNRLAFSFKLIDQDAATAKLERARSKFESAFTENDQARDALNQGRAAEGLMHIQASLKALSDTYDIFLDLQEYLERIGS